MVNILEFVLVLILLVTIVHLMLAVYLKFMEKDILNYFKVLDQVQFFPGFQYNSEAGSYAASIQAVSKHLMPQTTVVYYNGGCTFESGNWENSQILYTFSDNQKPAIILSKLGNGYGILSGVHFEYDPYLLEEQLVIKSLLDETKNVKLIETLKSHNSSRLKLFNNLMTTLLNSDCNSFFQLIRSTSQLSCIT
ncbi:hypothetical protein MN116_002520 [Schistosoma mekongi]|uniref:Biotin-protein ligase N-terminal domain-containing protein n=1 Tax=Schistosoma mekongi TaxID=38744 RepID=A0AAE1ZLC8_SCHME|nr:hypothetical protein MN116_002520 [Schistosoma mekongi]